MSTAAAPAPATATAAIAATPATDTPATLLDPVPEQEQPQNALRDAVSVAAQDTGRSWCNGLQRPISTHFELHFLNHYTFVVYDLLIALSAISNDVFSAFLTTGPHDDSWPRRKISDQLPRPLIGRGPNSMNACDFY